MMLILTGIFHNQFFGVLNPSFFLKLNPQKPHEKVKMHREKEKSWRNFSTGGLCEIDNKEPTKRTGEFIHSVPNFVY